VHPRFGDSLPEAAAERAATLEGTDLGALYTNLADFQLVAAREADHLSGLAEKIDPAPVLLVPFLRSDVHDLDVLAEVAGHLFGEQPLSANSARNRAKLARFRTENVEGTS
jgi:hypothetical protein